jgi:hypothetical protein
MMLALEAVGSGVLLAPGFQRKSVKTIGTIHFGKMEAMQTIKKCLCSLLILLAGHGLSKIFEHLCETPAPARLEAGENL